MAKPVGAACNMRCRYCYYQAPLPPTGEEKSGERILPLRGQGGSLMSEEILERYVQEYIEAQTGKEVLFCWHGGEPLLRPISFYEHALELQRRYARGRNITNTLQTNGTLITHEWAEFFHRNNFLLGVSIDGPEWLHNLYRPMRNGEGSWSRVMEGIRILNEHHVEWNAMAVVNNVTALHPLEFYNFFKEIECRYIQFTPIVEKAPLRPSDTSPKGEGRLTSVVRSLSPMGEMSRSDREGLSPESVNPHDFGTFLCTIFDEWWRKDDAGKYYIQLFDATLANWMGMEPGVCSMARNCGHAGVIEHNGDVYSCDHFVFPEHRLGNIRTSTLVSMMYGEKQNAFARMKQGSLPTQCRECEWLFACNGECPKNRILTTVTGERGLNYLCSAYRQFFSHIATRMDLMKKEIL